jgi:hypothetical protein
VRSFILSLYLRSLPRQVAQLLATVLVLVVALAAHVRFTPFVDSAFNIIEAVALFAELAVAFAILPYLSVRTNGTPQSIGAFVVIATILSLAFCIGWIFLVVDTFFSSKLRKGIAEWFADFIPSFHGQKQSTNSQQEVARKIRSAQLTDTLPSRRTPRDVSLDTLSDKNPATKLREVSSQRRI